MNKRSVICLLIIMGLLFFQGLSAQEGRGNGRVGGTVKDAMGNPIPGAKISLKILTGVSSGARKMLGDSLSTSFESEGKTIEKIEGGYQMNILSDKKGQWGIFGFATGEFLLMAEKDGYEPMGKIVNLSQMKRNPLIHIVLQKSGTPELKESPSGTGLKMGNALYNEGKYSEALPYFQESISKKPDQFEIGINLGNCYMALKKYEEAIKTFMDVISGYQKNNPELKGNDKAATVYASIGEAYNILEKYDLALTYYKKSMEIVPPTDAAVAYNTAEILFFNSKIDEAIEYYSLAAKLKPETAIYYAKLGYAYLRKSDTLNALSSFEKFAQLAPNDPQIPTINDMIKELKK